MPSAPATKGRPSQRSQPSQVAGRGAQAGISSAAHAAAASIARGRPIEPSQIRSLLLEVQVAGGGEMISPFLLLRQLQLLLHLKAPQGSRKLMVIL
jgi:hypothetical protein